MNDLEQYIQSYFGVEKTDLQKIASLFKTETLNKGDFFLRHGQYCERLSFVQEGLLRVFAFDGEKEVTQWISTPGYFVTDLASLVFGLPARWNVQALSDVRVFSISRNNYREIGQVIPRWHELEKLFIARCFTILEERIFSHLSLSAEARYDAFYKQNPDLFNQVPLQFIASMLGMTPETFSRIRKKRQIQGNS